ncbi:4-hydroxyphenylacetate 3-hydroxylase N-terminal domain-containing protein [Serpentinicella alkaliphila]|uniref:4-hydroxybutyryl-CoA dehydratase/vinylacetyl-CoA-Delta-isomerase n=1 Tax=Serpentinicella alkaliphila TaxID=1734049 RepID=A0A4R2TI57_9FIRM|nr:4-hydroxyphenylacetate 3-hydroxylase N-terminal domain-containing protein [Serpentinicella alkaliphila]QUH25916.1 4-hydroxyphenylacetate 3-hydroxylase [Serpentinicella alkaliphila]TCQ01987.1 4-hydroxybutyryl-CoA dehydratase/vinylacetyl-CoA-Delta-isomerase [Serpentinicella alkaliphila]
MALKTGEQYKESLRKMRPNVYKWDRLIEDITTDPVTRGHVASVAHSYDMSFDEKDAYIYTAKSHLTGEIAHRWNTLPQTAEDQMHNARMKRHQYRHSGTCKGATCAGWTGMTVLWAVTQEMDKEYGTNYHERLKNYFKYVEDNALALAGAITDAKGDRSLKPSQQKNKDSHVHIKEVREDGIVIRGYKTQICGIVGANEIIVVPGGGYGESEKDFCLAVAVPRDVEGLTCVITRKPSDTREEEEGWDAPKVGTITQAYLIFDDVFVPNERVFMAGEYKYSGKIIGYFAAIYRAAIGACVAGQGDVMIGAAINMARANGLSQKVFQDKLTQMAINNEINYGTGLGAMLAGKQHESGLYIPDALLAHVNKTQVAKLPYETKVITQDISGGIAETGCIPSYKDFQSELYGEHLYKALEAATDGESRTRAARLAEWLTVGAGIPGCMHGGGSPDGAKMVVKALTKWEDYAADAKRIAGITGEIVEPKKK